MKMVIEPKDRRYIMVGRCGVTYAEKGGRLVLKNETHWSKINGFFINTNRGCFWFSFRRHQF